MVLQTVYNLVKQRLFMHDGKYKTFISVLSNPKKSCADKYDELSKLLRDTQPELADCELFWTILIISLNLINLQYLNCFRYRCLNGRRRIEAGSEGEHRKDCLQMRLGNDDEHFGK
jgi:hypothetical protein